MSNLRLIADDLTGALDSAAQFCGETGALPVYLGRFPAGGLRGPAALDLACRDGDVGRAEDLARGASGFLSEGRPAFKKIDSLLRGHWAAELAALMKTGLFDTCILAPAFPAQGRTTRNGRQIVERDGRACRLPIDPAKELGKHGLEVALHRISDSEVPSGLDVVVCDAQDDTDLRRIVSACKRFDGPLLWCGSAGIARAMASRPPPCIPATRGPVLAIVGSHHPVTAGQIAHVETCLPDAVVRMTGDAAGDAAAIELRMARGGACLALFELPRAIEPEAAAAAIAEILQRSLPAVTRPATLVAAGGETLLSICRTLCVSELEVRGEYAPGVPGSVIRGGAWNGTSVVSKSGAFGSVDFLYRLLSAAGP
jgi:D-threonate/D-erythronate kinase